MLRRLIAHQITKQQHKTTGTTLHLRDKVLPVESELAASLVDQLSDSFVRRSPVTGKFRTDTGRPPFQDMLLSYLNDATDSSFIDFTKKATQLLSDGMSKQSFATGGYAVFAEYVVDDKTSFLLTALLSTTAQPGFDKDLNLVANITLDLDHLRHGARTRLEAVKDNEYGVVDFISQRKDGVSEYFVEFIGCEEIARPEIQGRLLQTALEDWARDGELDKTEKSRLMGEAYGYAQESRRQKRPITLTGIANALRPEDPKPLLDHLSKHGLAGQFSAPPPQIMKNFVRFAFSGDGLKLEFDDDPWRNRVTIRGRNLTIRGVPEDLITALNERE